jgi:glycosyltransferase involved in cell wall biosynthesis
MDRGGARTQVLFITGANPMRGGGGLESYVRAYAHAANAAGFEAHVFGVGRGSHVSREAFGYLHQVAVPPHTIRGVWAGMYSPALTRELSRHVEHDHLAAPVMIHAFGPYGCAGARFGQALERRGIHSVQVTSAYNTQEQESRVLLANVHREQGAANALRYLARYGAARVYGTRNERRGYEASRLLLVNYESVRSLLLEQFRADWEIRNIPYASDTAFRRLEDPGAVPGPLAALEPRDAPLVVCVSRHDARKGVDVLLRALATLQQAGVRFRACLVGRGELLDAHRRLAANLGLGRSVAITGQVPDVVPYLRGADVYVLPSLSEASGSVSLLEALQAGVATIASGCDGIPEDVADGESALVVPPGDATALARAIETLLSDAELRRRLAISGRQLYDERFSAERVTTAIGDLYAEFGVTPEARAPAR